MPNPRIALRQTRQSSGQAVCGASSSSRLANPGIQEMIRERVFVALIPPPHGVLHKLRGLLLDQEGRLSGIEIFTMSGFGGASRFLADQSV